jgi:hypothetical protein
MYVITDHNTQNFVILGPIEWKPRYISDILSDELDQDIVITREDETRVPFDVVPGVTIRKCISVYEEINTKIHRHEGPFWVYDDGNTEYQATATWEQRDKSLESVKADLKNLVADIRWKKEATGVTLTIQGTEVWCDTSRGNRDIFLQKYTIMPDNTTINWKFQNAWLELTKAELGTIVTEGSTYIQSCFDWEAAQSVIIDNCATLAELDALVFEDPVIRDI